MFPAQKSQTIINSISDYFLTTMNDYPKASSFWNPIYILEGVLMGSLTYLWLEYAQMGKLYHWLFPIIFSTTIVLGHFIITKLIFRFWPLSEITIGKFWGISLVGIILSFFIVSFMGICGILCMIIGSYCPTAWHTSAPDGIAVFFKIVLIPWGISTFLLTQAVLKKQIAEELASIKEINAELEKRKSENQIDRDPIHDEAKSLNAEDTQRSRFFDIPSPGDSRKIAVIDIYFIAVEDHYCRLVTRQNGDLHEELVRLTLKEALDNLPATHFAQVHRSYIVNLQHVKQIKKEGQAYQLYLEDNDTFLPASRHRAHTFLPKLKEILGQSTSPVSADHIN